MADVTVPGPQAGGRAPVAAPGTLTWLLAWAVVFCDIGTSVYYVPGILYGQVGDLSITFVAVTTLAFILLASKYTEVSVRNPEGGGVVTVATRAFGLYAGALGGMLITVDYFLTSAISTVSGFFYLGSVYQPFADHVVLFACLTLGFLAALNIIGIRESAMVALTFAVAAFIVDIAVIALTLASIEPSQVRDLWTKAIAVRGLPPRQALVGFAGAWLAFSGLESISQLSPALRRPLSRTVRLAMAAVVFSVIITSPILTALAVGTLPESTKATGAESFMSELAGYYGGLLAKVAVVLTASALLLFAANTAIIGGYHVFLALAKNQFLPSYVSRRNTRYRTPHLAILLATIVPIGVIVLTNAHMETLGDMYSFGLLGAFTFTSLGLDVLRWRDRRRGLVFVVGLFTTIMVLVSWGTNIIEKPLATLFGGSVTLAGLLAGVAIRKDLPILALNRVPFVARKAEKLRARVAEEVEEKESILTLEDAVAVRALLPSTTLVGLRGSNPRLIDEAIRRVRGNGEEVLYAVAVTEWPGLFSGEQIRPDDDLIRAINEAYAQAKDNGVTLVPIWRIAQNAPKAIAETARAMDVTAVMLGVSQRSGIYHMLRGNVLKGLAKLLPEERIRIMTVG